MARREETFSEQSSDYRDKKNNKIIWQHLSHYIKIYMTERF
jgi:hypothetical protein